MKIEQVRSYIDQYRPGVINLLGKTATGKSTLASELCAEFGYQTIELDRIVHEVVIDPHNRKDEDQAFADVYKYRHNKSLIEAFVAAIREKVSTLHAQGYPVIMDGGIANAQTLEQVVNGLPSGIIVYLHPGDLNNYRKNIMSRFMTSTLENNAGLPESFWSMVSPAAFEGFCRSRIITEDIHHAIEQYAATSQENSVQRLSVLKVHFDNIFVVDI